LQIRDTPDFDRADADHMFQVHDVIYVIDIEGPDIYEATIRAVDDDRHEVWYPDSQ
jgi:hypothetical protein